VLNSTTFVESLLITPHSAKPEGVNENLEEELGPEFATLSLEEQSSPLLLFVHSEDKAT
jgi:hypothetical protein